MCTLTCSHSVHIPSDLTGRGARTDFLHRSRSAHKLAAVALLINSSMRSSQIPAMIGREPQMKLIIVLLCSKKKPKAYWSDKGVKCYNMNVYLFTVIADSIRHFLRWQLVPDPLGAVGYFVTPLSCLAVLTPERHVTVWRVNGRSQFHHLSDLTGHNSQGSNQ